MRLHLTICLTVILTAASGCQTSTRQSTHEIHPPLDVIFVVHGVDGYGPWYSSLVEGLGPDRQIEMVEWGGPLLILPNLQLKPVHDAAQKSLGKRLDEWHKANPTGKITLIGHSAGCGVILETLATSDPAFHVEQIILLGPAVSARYDLAPAMKHVDVAVHAFYSEHDELLLKYGTSVAGTYDNVWGESAGLHGFTQTDKLPPEMRPRLIQHAYDPAWRELGNGGGHFGWRSKLFIQQVVAPLLVTSPTTRPGPASQPVAVLHPSP